MTPMELFFCCGARPPLRKCKQPVQADFPVARCPPCSLRPALYVEFFSAHDPGHAFLFGGDACLSLNPTWLRTLPATVGRCLAARPVRSSAPLCTSYGLRLGCMAARVQARGGGVGGSSVSPCACFAQASFPPAARVGDLCVLRKWFAPGRALRYLPHRRPRPVAHLPEACWDRQEVYSLQEQPETLLLDMLFDYNYDRPSVFIIAPLCVVRAWPDLLLLTHTQRAGPPVPRMRMVHLGHTDLSVCQPAHADGAPRSHCSVSLPASATSSLPCCAQVGGVPPFQRTPGSSVAHAASAWLAALPTLRILPTVADSGWRSPVDWWIVHQPPLWDEEALGVGGAAYVENWILPAEAAVEEAVEAKEDDHQPPSGASDSDSDGSVGRRWRREHEASCAARVREVAAVMQAEEGAGGALVGLHGLEGGDPIVVEDE